MSSVSTTAPKVTFERPWLGLSPFTEETQRFFFGRDREIGELYERIRGTPLTVLYGQSGLGKTSLLGAGLIPKLRVEGYRPLLLRLKYQPEDPPLLEQVGHALDELLGPLANPLKAPTLWERFHHRGHCPPDLGEAPPVVLFDQFEEIFTLTEDSEARQQEAEVLFHQLADLLENRPPASVQQRLREDRSLGRQLDFGPSPLRVVVTLREDFLSRLEEWKAHLPSLMRNRMALHKLNGPSAFEAVYRPGRLGGEELVKRAVAERIVCFVAKKEPETPLQEIRAVPPLLSLLCFELNEARRRDEAPAITADQVEGLSDDILEDFFERSFTGLDLAVRRFVEDELVSRGGHRNAVARGYALEKLEDASVDDASGALHHLVQARLLTAVEPGSRLEITHDVLAPYVVSSREQREERERAHRAEKEREKEERRAVRAERERRAANHRERELKIQKVRLIWALAAIIILALLTGASSLAAYRSEREAQQLLQAASKKAMGHATFRPKEFLNTDTSFAYLSEALRLWPENSGAQAAAASYLLYSNLAWPRIDINEPYRRSFVLDSFFSPDGRAILAINGDRVARAWRTHNGLPLTPPILIHRDNDQIRFSPDSKMLLTQAKSGYIRLWSLHTGKPLPRLLAHHKHSVLRASFSPDSQMLLTATGHRDIQVWDAQKGEPIAPTISHQYPLLKAFFDPTSKVILTMTNQGTIHIWSARTGKPLIAPIQNQNDFADPLFRPDGRAFISSGIDGTIRTWSIETGESLTPPINDNGIGILFGYSPSSGTILTASNEFTMRTWNCETGEPISPLIKHDSILEKAILSPDGRTALTADIENIIRAWDARTGDLLFALEKNKKHIYSLSFSPDGRHIITSRHHSSAVLNARNGEPRELYPKHGNILRYVSFSQYGNIAFVPRLEGIALIYNSRIAQASMMSDRIDAHTTAANFSPDGLRIITGSSDGSSRIWSPHSKAKIELVPKHSKAVRDATFSPHGGTVLTASDDHSARLWDAQTGQLLFPPLTHSGAINIATFSPDGKYILTGSDDATARLWDSRTGQSLSIPIYHSEPVETAKFSPGGHQALTAGKHSVLISDMKNGHLLNRFSIPKSTILAATFSHNDPYVLLRHQDGSAQIWNALTEEPLGEPLPQEESVHQAYFSPEGRYLATTSRTYGFRIWRTKTGRAVTSSLQHEGPIWNVIFSSDNKFVVTGEVGGSMRIWNIQASLLQAPVIKGTARTKTIRISPDDRHIFFGSWRSNVRSLEIPTPRVPPRAAKDLEMLSGFRIGTNGHLNRVPMAERIQWLSDLLTSRPNDTEWDTILRWYVSDPRARPLSPGSNVTTPERIESEIQWVLRNPDFESIPYILDNLYNLDPTHPLIHLALTLFEDHPATRELYLDLSMKRLSDQPHLAAKAAEILQRLEEPERALTAAEHTLELEPGSETAEAVKAWALEQLAAGDSEAGDEVDEPAA